MAVDLLQRARSGDREAFTALVEPYRGELHLLCYRMLGSLQDAEDTLQEVLLSAWTGLNGFEGRSSVRTWLHRIATNRCLNALRAATRRPVETPAVAAATPSRLGEAPWLQPYPDLLLDGLPDDDPGPEARYESREAVSLAFITAVQLLPPNQRAVLLLRDVLGYRAAETARLFFTSTYAQGCTVSHLIPTRANGRPAWGEYSSDPLTGLRRCTGILVAACTTDGISEIIHFETAVAPYFGFPRILA